MKLKMEQLAERIGQDPTQLYEELASAVLEQPSAECLDQEEVEAISNGTEISANQLLHLKKCVLCRASVASWLFDIEKLDALYDKLTG